MTIESRAMNISEIVEDNYGLDGSVAAEIAYNLLEQNPLAAGQSDEKLASIVATLIEMP